MKRKRIRSRPKKPWVTLDSLLKNETGVLHHMDFPEETQGSFGVMGFHPGGRIRMVRRAPLGDPIEVELLGYRLALRAREARRIFVKPCPNRGQP